MTRTITSKPADLTEVLFKAGGRVVVFVEGINDQYAFREWFEDRLSEIEFFDCGGILQVEKLLADFLAQSSLKRGYAIIDRDFRTEEQVEVSRKPNSHCFVLRRYSLENYLMDSPPVCVELEIVTGKKASASEVETQLLALCQKLKIICAVQWVCWEKRDEEISYWPDGHDIEPRESLIEKAAKDFGCDLVEAETLVAEKENLIAAKLNDLETAHTVISGKRLFHCGHRELGFNKLDKDHFRRMLVRGVKLTGLPDDVKAIVLDHILAAA